MNYCRDHSNEYYLNLIHEQKRRACKCGRSRWYRVRSSYVCACGNKYYPLAGTIFEKSRTPLKTWFYVIELFTKAKSGLSAMFISRIIGVTYKCAWRMLHKIRELMRETSKLAGTIEADETFFKAKPWRKTTVKDDPVFNYPSVVGMVERETGRVRVKALSKITRDAIRDTFAENIEEASIVRTDGSWVYKRLERHYYHEPTVHWGMKGYRRRGNFIAQKGDSTQAIEGFFSQLKRGIYGVYRYVKYLQKYADEFAFRYSYRKQNVFEVLVGRIWLKPPI